jgi:cobalt/nickel transport system permease protein
MQTIDTYAYASRLHRTDPAPRVLLAPTVLVLCLASERPAVGLLAAAGMVALTSGAGGIPAHVVGRTLLAEGTFLARAVVGVALSVSPSASPSLPWGQQLGPLWSGTGPAALTQAVRLFARALGGAAAMGFLALTTPLIALALIDLLRRWRVPPLLLDLMTLIYRFIFVLLDSLVMMRTAQANRLGYATQRRPAHRPALHQHLPAQPPAVPCLEQPWVRWRPTRAARALPARTGAGLARPGPGRRAAARRVVRMSYAQAPHHS